MKRIKKGFTIIELVIVIAVVGVLTAVLVPTFINLTNKANEAADQSLVKNLNTVLAMAEEDPDYDFKKPNNPSEMFDVLKSQGYFGETIIKKKKSDKNILYKLSTNRFEFDEGTQTGTDYWEFASTVPSTNDKARSLYLYEDYNSKAPLTINSGLDVGFNDEVSEIIYKNNVQQTAVIRTNDGSLTVDAPYDTVRHYGNASVLVIDAIAVSSYHEFGNVSNAQIKTGRVVIENETSKIDNLLLIAENDVFNNIVLETKSGASMPTLDRTDVNIGANGTLVLNIVTPSSNEYVYLTKAGVIEQVYVTTEVVDTHTTKVTDVPSAKVASDASEKTFAVAEQIANIGKKNSDGDYVDSNNNPVSLDELNNVNQIVTEKKADGDAIATGTEKFAGGAGTEKTPYLISTAQELQNIKDYLDGNFKLANDIDMSGVEDWTSIGSDSAPFTGKFDGNGYSIKNWHTSKALFETIRGNDNACLTGLKSDVLNNDYSLVEENISEDKYTAVLKNIVFDNCEMVLNSGMGGIASVVIDAYVESIEIKNSKIRFDSGWFTAAMFGEVYKSHIKGLHLAEDNSIISKNQPDELGNSGLIIGGICGGRTRLIVGEGNKDAGTSYISSREYRTVIDGCINDASATLNKTSTYGFIGGIVGCIYSYDKNEVIINCKNNGNITVNNAEGSNLSLSGVCGAHMGGSGQVTIVNCENNGNLTLTGNPSKTYSNAAYNMISGICSYGTGPYINCSNSGKLSGDVKYIGGICGRSADGNAAVFTQCTNTGYFVSENPGIETGEICAYISGGENVNASNINNLQTNPLKINLTNADSASGTMIMPASVSKMIVQGSFGFTAIDLTNKNGTVELNVSNATFTLVGNNANASFTVVGENNTVVVAEGAVLNNIKLEGAGNKITNYGSIGHLSIVNSSEEIVNGTTGSIASVVFNGNDNLAMTFTNNGSIGQNNGEWHSVQTQSKINLTFNNNGTIYGNGKKYGLLFYGMSNVVFNANAGSKLVIENPIYTAVFSNVEDMRANTVVFNVASGAEGVSGDSYYGITTHNTLGTQVTVNLNQ